MGNIAVCMLEMKTPTSTSLMSSTPSSVNTTVSQLDSNTFPTWMSRKSRETLPMMSQYTLSEYVLDDLSKDSVSPPESPRNNVGVEKLMSGAFAKFSGDLSGNYYPLTGMDEGVRQQLVDDHFLFMSGDPNLKVAGMERDWPEG